jgi:hypothetical protein
MKKAVKTILSLPVLGLAMLVGAQSSMALTQIEAAKLIAGDGATGDAFGYSVAVDGDTAVIGARSADNAAGVSTGSAYVFTRSDGFWSLQARLSASDGAAGDRFGAAVAVDGDTAVVGANFDNNDAGVINTGSAYLFSRSGVTWTEQARLIASDGGRNHLFGSSLAVDGSTVVVGAWGADGNVTGAGSAYVFTESGGFWSEAAKLSAGDGVSGDWFGISVALNGNTAVIGASRADGNVTDAGSAYVFTESGGFWSEQASLNASNGAAGDLFGVSVSLQGATAVIGAERGDGDISDTGAAYVFTPVGCAGWSEQAKLIASDGAANDAFGGSVSVAGDTAVIGAIRADGVEPDSGSAYVFALQAGDAGPIASEVQASPNPVAVNNGVALTATVAASFNDGSTIASASYSIDGGTPPAAMDAVDGAFDDVSEDITAALPAFSAAGFYTVAVTGTDSEGNTGAPACVRVVVYDPDSGFVTGNGRIDSPAGAYAPDPTVTGTAIFGFDAKYTMGASTPSGSTQFRFKAGDLKFSSHDYEWLVVDGARAVYQGVGTIGGTGNYGFMLSIIDDALEPSTAVDLFRFRIWDKDNGGAVIYDNEMGVAEDADPTAPIISGSIVIH